MNDAQSTIVGLKAQHCPGGGWNGMPAELDGRATVADCLANKACGCIYGDAVQHIEQMREALAFVRAQQTNGCTVDLEPCYPVEFCTCAEDAKKSSVGQSLAHKSEG